MRYECEISISTNSIDLGFIDLTEEDIITEMNKCGMNLELFDDDDGFLNIYEETIKSILGDMPYGIDIESRSMVCQDFASDLNRRIDFSLVLPLLSLFEIHKDVITKHRKGLEEFFDKKDMLGDDGQILTIAEFVMWLQGYNTELAVSYFLMYYYENLMDYRPELYKLDFVKDFEDYVIGSLDDEASLLLGSVNDKPLFPEDYD